MNYLRIAILLVMVLAAMGCGDSEDLTSNLSVTWESNVCAYGEIVELSLSEYPNGTVVATASPRCDALHADIPGVWDGTYLVMLDYMLGTAIVTLREQVTLDPEKSTTVLIQDDVFGQTE